MTARKRDTRALMTTEDLAAFLRFPPETVKEWRRRREGPPYIKVNGALVRYRPEDVDEWLNAQKVDAA